MSHNILNGPSQHLSWNELRCKDKFKTPYPTEFILDGRVFELAHVFEITRSLYSKPIKILSAYRTPDYNKQIGGARNSQHLHGRALDLSPPNGISNQDFYKEIRNNIESIGVTGLGKYRTFVHIDIRKSLRLVVWSGSGVKDS